MSIAGGRLHTSLLVLALAWLVGACGSMPAHRWVDSEYGFAVQSDYDRQQVEPMLGDSVGAQLGSLSEVFGVDEFGHLTILVLDRPGPDMGGSRASALHDPEANEIHLYARFAEFEGLSLMRPDTGLSLSHELVHACIRRADLTVPRWMEEGLCDVLAVSTTDGDGRFVLLWADERETEVRALREKGVWLTAEDLFAVQDSYPDLDALAPLYAQSGSLVGFLLHQQPEQLDARERVHAVLALGDDELRAAFTEWEAGLDSTSPAEQYLDRLPSADSALRVATADRMQRIYVDEAWWTLLETLLADPDASVRKSARLPALFAPADTLENADRFARWARTGNRELRLSGLLCAAQIGGIDASIAFLDAFGVESAHLTAADWFIPLTWVVLANRELGTKDAPLPFPDVALATTDPAYLPEFAAAFAARLRGSRTDAR